MVSGKAILNELDFETKMKTFKDRELLEFVARQNYETCSQIALQDTRIKTLEGGNKLASSVSGGITGTFTSIVIAVISYFSSK
jgi:hypothetical protein